MKSSAILIILLSVAGAGCSGSSQTASASPSATTAASDMPTQAAQATVAPAATSAIAASAEKVHYTDVSGIYAEQAIDDEGSLGILDTTSGAFHPDAPITRAEFVRWLVKANNDYSSADPTKRISLAQSSPPTFVDVPRSDPDFKYIQGLADAGYVIGKNATHFAPNQWITREEMVAIKAPVDEGQAIALSPSDVGFLVFSDKSSINPQFVSDVHEDFSVRTTQNIGRVWGSIKIFHPRQPLTRAEAAIAIAEVGKGSAAVALGRTPPPAPQ
jgi:hypothetical protein